MFGTLAASTLHHAVLGTVMYVIFGREWQSLRDEDVLKKELGKLESQLLLGRMISEITISFVDPGCEKAVMYSICHWNNLLSTVHRKNIQQRF